MANLACWISTKLPNDIVKILEKDLLQWEEDKIESKVESKNPVTGGINKKIRDSSNVWIPSNHWMTGWIWYYVRKVNNENFLYDISDIDNGKLQYTIYSEGDFYDWHADDSPSGFYQPKILPSSSVSKAEDVLNVNGEFVRKLSFSLQLSSPDDYEGGDVEFLSVGERDSFTAPKDQGTIIVFDSRIKHRVTKVKSGTRKSIVGWVVGPRWK